MKKQIGNYEFELANDIIMIREAGTKRLLRAKTIKPFEAVDKFNALCKHWEAKLKQTALAV